MKPTTLESVCHVHSNLLYSDNFCSLLSPQTGLNYNENAETLWFLLYHSCDFWCHFRLTNDYVQFDPEKSQLAHVLMILMATVIFSSPLWRMRRVLQIRYVFCIHLYISGEDLQHRVQLEGIDFFSRRQASWANNGTAFIHIYFLSMRE